MTGRACALSIAVTLLWFQPAARAKGGMAPPAGLAGNWDVEHVAVDHADQMHWEVRPDDPTLVGRELIISAEEVRFTADKDPCQRPVWTPLTTTWGKLFDRGFQRPPGGGRSTRPTPEDFEFVAPKQAKVKAYLICPTKGQKPAEAWMQARWLALQEPDTLAMHYSNQVLLILKRRPCGATPRASFPCEKAASPTEKAICSDFGLAGWDRSIAAAWNAALERGASKRPQLAQAQKEWLAKRDSCGADPKCLDDMMWRRVDELVQQ